jgi:hypothetical protein
MGLRKSDFSLAGGEGIQEFLDPFAAFLSQAGFAAVLQPAC